MANSGTAPHRAAWVASVAGVNFYADPRVPRGTVELRNALGELVAVVHNVAGVSAGDAAKSEE